MTVVSMLEINNYFEFSDETTNLLNVALLLNCTKQLKIVFKQSMKVMQRITKENKRNAVQIEVN